MDNITFVVAANDRGILNKNLLASPFLQGNHGHQVLIEEGRPSAAFAYNAGLQRSTNELVVFVHQDVFLPEGWLADLSSGLETIGRSDSNWGVIGSCGHRKDGLRFGHLYTPGEGVIGRPMAPQPVQTLDEVLLVLRKSSKLKFDEQLPGFHFYGTDICLAAATQGMQCYAVSAFCIHNSCQYFEFPPEFYSSYRLIKSKWRHALPIQTSCIRVSRFDWDPWKRRVKRAIAFTIGRSLRRGERIEDPNMILQRIQADSRV
jgi:Glycosyltransferase like family